MQSLLDNRYRVIQTLGSGGFGDTFLAEDTQMPSSRRCVIKQLKPIQNNPQIYQLVQERFQREAAILEDLGGATDQIPTLYAYFQSEGQFYVIQEWIEGDTLTAKLQKQGLFSESSVRDILVNLLPVLDYVHSKRIIHRDIKPDNIIVRHRDGKPILIDFGAVRESMGTVFNSQGNHTSSIVIGTPGYMPSEQAAGRPVYSSDLYSLGITAIYLLTGKQPQELETDSRTGEIVWRQYAWNISPTLAGVIDRAIAYHPRERFATAREMLEALQGIVNFPPTIPHIQPQIATVPSLPIQQNTVAVSPGATPQPQNQGGGQKGILLGSLIVGGLIGTSIVVGFVLNRPNQPAVQPIASSSETPITSNETQNTAPTVSSQLPNTSTRNETQNTAPTVSPQVPDTNVNRETPSPQTPTPTEPITSQPPPAEAVQNYYATINQGQYRTAWNQLAPSLQNNKRLHPNGYLSYIDWWGGRVQSIDVEQVSMVEANAETATVDAQLKYYLKNGRQTSSSVRFSLLWDAENIRWVVSDAR